MTVTSVDAPPRVDVGGLGAWAGVAEALRLLEGVGLAASDVLGVLWPAVGAIALAVVGVWIGRDVADGSELAGLGADDALAPPPAEQPTRAMLSRPNIRPRRPTDFPLVSPPVAARIASTFPVHLVRRPFDDPNVWAAASAAGILRAASRARPVGIEYVCARETDPHPVAGSRLVQALSVRLGGRHAPRLAG